MKLFAVIRLRGTVKARRELEETLRMLRLNRKMHCVVVPDTDSYKGMLQAAKDFITWGDVAPETLKKLLEKRGRKAGNKRLETEGEVSLAIQTLNEGKGLKETAVKPVFRLTPPSKGFKHSIKDAWPRGELGYRGGNINELLERMM
jgi:large subunit ribosomal protein L30